MAALAISLATPLAAQTPAKPDPAAEAAAAMERAKRQAAGPMRIILEASKARRRAGEGEAGAPATAAAPSTASADVGGVRSVTSRSAVPAAAGNTASATVASPPVSSPAPAPASALTTPVAAAPAATASPDAPAARDAAGSEGVVTQITLDAGKLGSKTASVAVPGLESSSAVGPIVTPLDAAPQVTVPQPKASDRVRLLTMVEPELPQRMLEEMGRNATLLVDLRLRADGSVASVELASPAPRGMLRMLAPTLEQWTFAPLASPRTHRIELLFNAER